MPAIDDVPAVTAALFAVAARIIASVCYLFSFRECARSPVVVGRVIGMFVLAGILSAAALVFALLTLAFSQRVAWGRFGVAAIGRTG